MAEVVGPLQTYCFHWRGAKLRQNLKYFKRALGKNQQRDRMSLAQIGRTGLQQLHSQG
jgi:hypothetical protein